MWPPPPFSPVSNLWSDADCPAKWPLRAQGTAESVTEGEGWTPNTGRECICIKNSSLLGTVCWNLGHCLLEQLGWKEGYYYRASTELSTSGGLASWTWIAGSHWSVFMIQFTFWELSPCLLGGQVNRSTVLGKGPRREGKRRRQDGSAWVRGGEELELTTYINVLGHF